MRNIDITEYFLDIFQLLVFDKHPVIAMCGGRGGGKSVFAARKIIFRMQTDGRNNAVVFRQNEKDLSTSCFPELKKAIEDWGTLVYKTAYREELHQGKEKAHKIAEKEKQDYLALWKYNTSPLKITYLPCGNKIVFRGCNDPQSVKSITTETGYFTIRLLEEAQQIQNKVTFDEIDKSFRGIPDDMVSQWLICFNSPLNTHWLRDFVDRAEVKVNFPKHRHITEGYEDYTYKSISLTKGDNPLVLAHYSVYKDNPYLTDLDIQKYEADKKVNPKYFEWLMLGEFGSTTGQVLTNYEIQDFDIREVIKPKSLRERSKFKILAGLDLGFVHPTAFYLHAIDKENKLCYVFDGFSATGLTNQEIAGEIISRGYGKEKIIIENAEPRTIKDLKQYGLNLKPIHKIHGGEQSSIMQGIKIMMKYKIIIHSSLKDYIRCITNWNWAEDKNGRALERPVNVDDDEITCMTKDTIVLTKNGYKNIDKVKVDEVVLTYNENKKKFEYNKVLESGLTKKDTDVYEMTLNDNTKIKLTPTHRLLTNKGWKKVKDIKEGEETLCYNLNQENVALKKVIGLKKLKNKEDVYNLSVENNHNYIVQSGVISHNCSRYVLTDVEKIGFAFGDII